ncbi:Subtilisin DY [Burkholderiales bacterium]|nr:Subtilisin DY [Burkholderiales bacterium]
MRIITVFALIFGMVLAGGAVATEFAVDLQTTSLIVKFERNATDAIYPEDAVDVVSEVASGQDAALTGTDWSIYTRIGSPASATWLIRHRLPADYLEALRAEEPDHPELHLQEYVVLHYADIGSRLAAEARLAADNAVRSFRPNSAMRFHARLNDYYVATTGPGQIPGGYQWGPEAIGAMSPYTNPTAQSGWDKATGYGYVTVIDTGIERAHPDLQENFRPHFSQAFYSGPCAGNSAVEVDETGGAYNTCPNSAIGHGTHVAGIIGATANNTIGVGGVCWNCSLIIAKTYQKNDPPTADLYINGLNHAIIRGAQAANLSAGIEYYLYQYPPHGSINYCSQLAPGTDGFCDAISLARRREIVFVASTGNQDWPTKVDFPASEPNVVAAAATTHTGTVWYTGTGDPEAGSNLGKVDLVAPGARVVSTFYTDASYNPIVPCNDINGLSGYDECTGTSMAAPHVTAALAIVRSINPLSSASTIIALLTSTGSNIPKPPGVYPAGNYRMPNLLAAINQAIANGSTWPAFAMVTTGGSWNRFTTVAPQMARAAIAGTMLPTLNASTTPVYYVPDANAPVVTGYPAFPDSTVQPRAYFKVYTKLKVNQTTLKPLYRLSKLQDVGNGRDACGNLMPVPGKPIPVIHTYTTNKTTRNQLTGNGSGQCYKYDGVEGYVAPSNLGSLQQLYQIYNPTADSYILVPSSKVALANSLGYTLYQTSLGWVVPN